MGSHFVRQLAYFYRAGGAAGSEVVDGEDVEVLESLLLSFFLSFLFFSLAEAVELASEALLPTDDDVAASLLEVEGEDDWSDCDCEVAESFWLGAALLD